MEKKRRIVSTTDEEIEQKRLKMNAQKTIKQNIAAATLLRKYLKEKHLDTAFEHYKFFYCVILEENINHHLSCSCV
jgi:hypothetical protein